MQCKAKVQSKASFNSCRRLSGRWRSSRMDVGLLTSNLRLCAVVQPIKNPFPLSRKSSTTLPKPLAMGYNTALLKRYTEAFCRGLANIIQHASNVIPLIYQSSDHLSSTLDALKASYLSSFECDAMDVDGADYAMGNFGSRNLKTNND